MDRIIKCNEGYPITHEDCVLDNNGVTIGSKVRQLQNDMADKVTEAATVQMVLNDIKESGDIPSAIAAQVANNTASLSMLKETVKGTESWSALHESQFGENSDVKVVDLGFMLEAGKKYRFICTPGSNYSNAKVAVSTSTTGSSATERIIIDKQIVDGLLSVEYTPSASARYLRLYSPTQLVDIEVSEWIGERKRGLVDDVEDVLSALDFTSNQEVICNGFSYAQKASPFSVVLKKGKPYILQVTGAVADTTKFTFSLSLNRTSAKKNIFDNKTVSSTDSLFQFTPDQDYPFVRFWASTDVRFAILQECTASSVLKTVEESEGLVRPLDLLERTVGIDGWYINTNAIWHGDTNATTLLVDVENLSGYVRIKATYAQVSYAFLSRRDVPTEGEQPSFCAGYSSRNVLPIGESLFEKIPSDCKYIYILYRYFTDLLYPDVMEFLDATSFTELGMLEKVVSENVSVPRTAVYVAASNSKDAKYADYVCSGTHDEVIIQQAIDSIQGLGNVILLSGDYYIDNLAQNSGSKYYRPCAIAIKGFGKGVLGLRISGTDIGGGAYSNEELNRFNSAVFHITDSGCNSATVSSALFGADKAWLGIDSSSVRYEHFKVIVERYDKPVMVFDNTPIGGVSMEDLSLFVRGFNDIVIPNRELIAIHGQEGFNYGVYNYYKDVKVGGFYTGFQLGGEHLVLINVQSRSCVYGYTFNDFQITHGESVRPITMINCSSEQDAALPRFNNLGGGRKITMIDFNVEGYIDESKSQNLIPAQERVKGSTTGFISWSYCGGKNWNMDFWESGHGGNIETHRTDVPKSRDHQHVGSWYFDGNKPIFCKNAGEKGSISMNVSAPNTKVGTLAISLGGTTKTIEISRVCTSASDFAKEIWQTAVESGLSASYDGDKLVQFYASYIATLPSSALTIEDNTDSTFTTNIESLGSRPVWVNALGEVV